MRNAPEVVREVGVDDVRVTTEHQLLHLYDCLLGISPGAVGVDFRRKIGFEDRFQHQQHCCHADPILHDRDAQRPEFAVRLRYKHSSDGLWPVGLLPERKRQFSQPSLDPIRLDVRKILAVDPRRALRTAKEPCSPRQAGIYLPTMPKIVVFGIGRDRDSNGKCRIKQLERHFARRIQWLRGKQS